MSTTVRKTTRVIGILLALGGLVMMVAGVIAWSTASSTLAKQKINVAAEGESPNYANGPFDALDQIKLIQGHTVEGVEAFGLPAGTVYSEVPRPDSALLAQCKSDATMASTDECKTAVANDAARTYLDNSNFKQASLYTSVMAFGVSALVVGLGIALILIGWAEFARSKKPAAQSHTADTRSREYAAV